VSCGKPYTIVRGGRFRTTRDGRYRVQCRFGLMWVAYRRCACERSKLGLCCCRPVRLPGGFRGEAFHTLGEIQEALRRHYARHWPAVVKGSAG
jgi:hypothetical protein